MEKNILMKLQVSPRQYNNQNMQTNAVCLRYVLLGPYNVPILLRPITIHYECLISCDFLYY